jgi:hypothetical protein
MEVNAGQALDVAFDVGKEQLNCIFEIGQQRYEDEFRNRTRVIRARLESYLALAQQHGFTGLRVLCEPSGGYEGSVMKVAHQLHCLTAYVGGEASHKFRMVVHGDPGKTDTRDPQALLAVAAQGKVLTHRILPRGYHLLREINREWDWMADRRVRVRCEVHALLVRLFPDLPVGSDFLYEACGVAMARQYGWNPQRIVSGGFARLERHLRKASTHVRQKTITRIWDAAWQSVELHDGGGAAEYLAERLQRHYEEFDRLERLRQLLQARLEKVYLELREKDPRLPAPVHGVIKLYMLARIVGETGPLTDFQSVRQLYRFAGLNLCERKSGKYEGKTKISRKGRVPLRRILGLAVFPLLREDGLYGAWFRSGRQGPKKTKGMAALLRKFLRLLFGWYRSGREFDRRRVFAAAGEYATAAA